MDSNPILSGFLTMDLGALKLPSIRDDAFWVDPGSAFSKEPERWSGGAMEEAGSRMVVGVGSKLEGLDLRAG